VRGCDACRRTTHRYWGHRNQERLELAVNSKLDLDLARNAAPMVAIGYSADHDLFSARTGCQTDTFYGIDLAALCI
jgi:hypothetical protein